MSVFQHLYYRVLNENDITPDSIMISDLQNLIRDDQDGREIDTEISNLFPLNQLGNPTDFIRIHGSRSLMEKFNEIDAEKLDLTETLDNIEIIGFSDDGEVILNFLNDGWSAHGIYDFSSEFLDDFFHMAKYAKFCLDLNQQDIVINNIREIKQLIPETAKQYRFLMSDDEMLLRGLTSTRYNYYDNHLALYLVFYSLHRYAVENDLFFRVSKAYLSDSEIRVYFEQENQIAVDGVGNIKFGAYLQNSEIKDSKLYFEFRYILSDFRNPNRVFSGRPDISDAILQIQHSRSIKNLSQSMEGIWSLSELKETMINHIRSLRQIQQISPDALYSIYRQITRSRTNFCSDTRNTFKELYNSRMVDNTFNIIEAFDLIDTITTDVDERILLERIYHEVLMDMVEGL